MSNIRTLFIPQRQARVHDPNLGEDFDSREVFNGILGKKKVAEDFEQDCLDLADQSLQQLQDNFNRIFAEIQAEARTTYMSHVQKLGVRIGSKTKDWKGVDQLFENVLESFLPRLLPVIVSVINEVLAIQLYDVQIIAGLQLYKGSVLEMRTGEGKTFVIPIAATLFGIRSRLLHRIYLQDLQNNGQEVPVHHRFQIKVVTANDYLARRDYSLLHPIYELFGLSSYYVQEVSGGRDSAHYFSFDILYCTCRHMCHLSLHDLMRKTGQQPFISSIAYVAILDEIDQILLDEALTPHIISQSNRSPRLYDIDPTYQANKLAGILHKSSSLFYIEKGRITPTPATAYYLRYLIDDLQDSILPDDGNLADMFEAQAESFQLLLQELRKEEQLEPAILLERLEEHSYFQGFWQQFTQHSSRFVGDFAAFTLQMLAVKFPLLIINRQVFRTVDLIYKFQTYSPEKFQLDRQHFLRHLARHQRNSFFEFCEFIGALFQFNVVLDKPLVTRYVDNLITIWQNYFISIKCCKTMEAKPVSLIQSLFDLYNNIVPKIDTFAQNRKGVDMTTMVNFDVHNLLKFMEMRDGVLRLRPEMQRLIIDNEKLKEYLRYRAEDIQSLLVLNSPAFMSSLIQCMIGANLLPLARLILETREELRPLSYASKEVVEKELDQLYAKLFYFSGFEAFMQLHEDIKLAAKIIDQAFEGGSETAVNIIAIEKIEWLFTMLLKVIESETSMNEMSTLLQSIGQELTKVKDQKSFKQARLGHISLIFFIIGKSLEETDIPVSVKLREVVDIFCAALFELFRTQLSPTFFVEHSDLDDEILRLHQRHVESDPYLSKLFGEVIFERVVNPFKPLQNQVKGMGYSSKNVTDLSLFVLASNEQKAKLLPFIRDHSWINGVAYYAILTNDNDFKRTTLRGTARLVAKQYYQELVAYGLNRGATFEEFFLQVERCFNVNLFYEEDKDFIKTTIDQNLEPNKIKYDPYLQQSERQQIQIINHITGRVMVNNRWSNYIHSAVEAKEKLLVRGENLATSQVSPQTYFATYYHLTGLSGTTIVAREEFKDKYGLGVTYVPTNRPISRYQIADRLAMSNESALSSIAIDAVLINFVQQNPILVILEDIKQCQELEDMIRMMRRKLGQYRKQFLAYLHSNGQTPAAVTEIADFCQAWNDCFETDFRPVAFKNWQEWIEEQTDVGLKSFQQFLEVEELLLKDFTPSTMSCDWLHLCYQYVLGHNRRPPLFIQQLTGKPDHLTKESDIIKDAGQKGNLLIATRVAGRGTDIKLEDPSKGLYMLILNHQESKRHDQQIFGRCGRQGDVGFYRFYNSTDEKSIYGKLIKSVNTAIGMSSRELLVQLLIVHYASDPGILISQEELARGAGRIQEEEEASQEEMSHILRQQLGVIQTSYEQSAHLQRIHEKRVGDLTFAYEKKLGKDIESGQKWRQQLLVGIELEHQCNEHSFLQNTKQVFVLAVQLLQKGVKLELGTKLLVDYLYALYCHHLPVSEHLFFVLQISSILGELSESENYSLESVLDHPELFLLESKAFQTCEKKINKPGWWSKRRRQKQHQQFITYLKDWDKFFKNIKRQDQQESIGALLNTVLSTTYAEVESKRRKEALTLYNKIVELFKSKAKFSILLKYDVKRYEELEEISEVLTEQTALIDQVVLYRLCQSIFYLLTLPQLNTENPATRFVTYYLSQRQGNRSFFQTDTPFKMLIEDLRLPYSQVQLQALVEKINP